MIALNHSTLPAGHLIGAAAPQQTGIVHFGLGNFHRAHAAVNTAIALASEPGDWGIVGIANRSHKVTDAMEAQEFLYSVVTLDPAREEVGVVDVHRRMLVAAEDGPEVLAAIADPHHKILTLTISEAGYHPDARTGALRTDSPDIAADLAPGAEPKTPLGQIVFGLMRRHAEGGAPITVLSCDNLLSAGNTTKAAGAIFSDEVEKYELVKLRLLNGGHSLIAYLGGLDRQETIPDSSGQDFVHQCTRAALVNEDLPSIDRRLLPGRPRRPHSLRRPGRALRRGHRERGRPRRSRRGPRRRQAPLLTLS